MRRRKKMMMTTMLKTGGISFCAIFCAQPVLAQEAPGVLVSAEWLEEHLDDPSLVLLHVGMPTARSGTAFIPGTHFLNYQEIAQTRDGLIAEIPPVDMLIDAFERAGVSNDALVIVYGSPGHLPARVYMTLDYLGHGDRTAVLNGGLEAWRAEDRPVMTSLQETTRATFTPSVQDDVLVTAQWMAERLDDGFVTLIDARPEGEYTGARAPRTGRPGHIPGAYNLYWEDLTVSSENPVLRSLAEVQARFSESGANRLGTVVSYCYIGMRASYTYMGPKRVSTRRDRLVPTLG
jgi:thiosulfate/3-mercaptopyruvate sulfurtransferase